MKAIENLLGDGFERHADLKGLGHSTVTDLEPKNNGLSHEMSGRNVAILASSLELFRMDRPSPIAIVPASICYAGRNDGDAEWAQGNFF